MTRLGYLTLLVVALGAAGCEDEKLFGTPPPFDGGVVDAGFPDSGIRELRDAGFLTTDAGVEPDAGFPPPAVEPVYIHTGTTLFSYAPESNAIQRIGDFHDRNGPLARQMVDIAIDLNGTMYGGTREPGGEATGNEVFLIDPETGFCTLRFIFDDTLHGMTFLPDGRLVIAGEQVSVVDPNDGAVLLEFPAARDYQTSGDIVGLPDGKLYWTVVGGNTDQVVRIDPASGRITNLGDARLKSIFGLGYAENQLFGFSSTGYVVVINPTNGAVLRQERLDGRWYGATTNPVRWE
jgi:hypothetical protein